MAFAPDLFRADAGQPKGSKPLLVVLVDGVQDHSDPTNLPLSQRFKVEDLPLKERDSVIAVDKDVGRALYGPGQSLLLRLFSYVFHLNNVRIRICFFRAS